MIRFKRTEDQHLLRSLEMACMPFDKPYEKDGASWWVGWEKSRPVCFCGVKEVQGMAFLCLSGVVRTHRGQGLQLRMIRIRERWAKRNDLEEIITYTATHNTHSANNLIRAGFFLYTPQDEYAKESNYWRKTLA